MLSPQAAGYVAKSTDPNMTCAKCVSFMDGKCDIVEGDISPNGTCNAFRPLDAGTAGPDMDMDTLENEMMLGPNGGALNG